MPAHSVEKLRKLRLLREWMNAIKINKSQISKELRSALNRNFLEDDYVTGEVMYKLAAKTLLTDRVHPEFEETRKKAIEEYNEKKENN